MKKKIFSLILASLIILPALASCTNNTSKDTGEQNSSDPTDSTPVSTVEDTLNFDVDYEGMDFNVLLASVPTRTPNDFSYGDDLTDVMNEAIYTRNTTMLENYNVNIVCKQDLGSNNQGYETVQKDYSSNKNSYQLCLLSGYDAAELALIGTLYDFKSLPNINTKNTWWDQAAERDLSIADSLFFTTGSISTVIDDYTYCVIFNKALLKIKLGDVNVYDIVRNDQWTLDKLEELSKSVKEDINGDQKMDSRDRYGLMIWDNEMIASINAAGEKIASLNEDGMVELTFYNDKVNTIVDKFVTIGNSEYCINFQHMSGGVQFYDMFTNNQAMFFMSMFNEVERFRDMHTDYGIVPNPKLYETDDYYSPISPWHSGFLCVPVTIEDPDSVSNIIELMGYHSEKLITPAYYDKTLIGKYVRDDESIEMLDLIFQNRVYDVGHLYRISSLQEHITNLLRENRPSGLSYVYQTYLDPANADINELNFSLEILKITQSGQ